ncbi:MAG: TVP38/TMEM64 family protein [Gemmatimonadetes bacterium]|nr:TVP38/TMEM64 family protein [Gemmatimonadota bacterium]
MRIVDDSSSSLEPQHPDTAKAPQKAGDGRWLSARRIAIGVVALVAIVLLGRAIGGYLPAFAGWVAAQGVWGPVIFIAGYAIATVAAVPGALLTLAAGAIFGIAAGVVYVFLGAVIGSSLAFLIARYVARPAVERRLAAYERFKQIDRAVGERGRKIVFLLRLSPALPFNVLNYALGLTRVRFRDYMIASIGMLPGTLLFVYSGQVAGDVAVLATGAGVERGTGYYLVLALGLLATATVTVWVTRIARNALRQETGSRE